jgi:VWFA-related protein
LRIAQTITAAWLLAPLLVAAQDLNLNRRTPESEAARAKLEHQITLDIEVTDETGKPVHGLAQTDFTLRDNGEPKPLTSFQEIENQSPNSPVEAILLLDAMNATFEDAGIMRQGIETFLKQQGEHLPLPTSIVFLTDTGIKLNKPTTNGLELANDFSKLQTPLRVLDSAQGVGGAMDRAQRSLYALQMLTKYESSRPGRKLLLWMGPGWPLLAGARASSLSPEDQRRYYTSIVETTTQLRRAHITLYSVAPLNLSHDSGQSTFLYQGFLKAVTAPAQADSPNLAVQVLATHSGGLVLNKSGDIPSQINRCLADAGSFYEVTFDASPGDELGVYHSIDVKTDRPGTTARTDSSYYAGPPQFTGASLATAIPPSPSAESPARLRAQARLVILDVTVLDNKGAPIVGLKPEDLQLLDDGHPQAIANLEQHTGVSENPSSTTQSPPSSASYSLSNKHPDGNTWNIVAVDLINTPKEDRGHLQDQLDAFARKIPQGTRIALVSMGGTIKVLSTFEDGEPGFLRALKKGLGATSVGGPANIIEREEVAENIDVVHPESLQHKAEVDVERQAQRAQMTLDDFASIAGWLKSYPGKKNVFWLSSGFPIEGKPFGTTGYNNLAPTAGGQRLPMQEKTDKDLETARIAVYPIDARGVAIADIQGETSADTSGACAACQLTNANKDSDLKAGQQSEMLEIAHATGGEATFRNDLSSSLLKEIHEGETYYTLSYTPQDAAWDGRYHRFKLKLAKDTALPAAHMIYRQGYYARDVQPQPTPTTDQFKAALLPDTPPAASVLFAVNAVQKPETEELEYEIDPATVQFTPQADGKLLADLDCAILEYNAKGTILEKALIRLSDTPSQPTQPPAAAIHARQTIAIKPGATTLVIGIRDRATAQFGTLQLDLTSR